MISSSNENLRNLLITISYDGSKYHGWQIQQNAVTVQEVFQQALYSVINDKPDIKACSRTDSGVHAEMFCISTKISHPIPAIRLKAALNSYLPESVVVLDVKEVSLDFHARYNAKGKRYIYRVLNRMERDPFYVGRALHYKYDIDVELLNKASKAYIGSHDFTSFCTLDNREKGDFVRTIYDFSVVRKGDIVEFSVEGNGFLYNMVRIMVGTLLYINEGKLSADSIPDIISAESRDAAGPTAPPQGLYLNKVFYDL
ncbi:MAG: tRNA pseudouridine(38-40) synthase TruA [Ruminococcus sp.]|nr:tRNA pseudouridine(38-40) synthase TruA [Ruminococcus sp.]